MAHDADPVLAVEKLLEVRFHMKRAAHGQREMVRLRPNLRDPYPPGPLRDKFGSGSMADTCPHCWNPMPAGGQVELHDTTGKVVRS